MCRPTGFAHTLFLRVSKNCPSNSMQMPFLHAHLAAPYGVLCKNIPVGTIVHLFAPRTDMADFREVFAKAKHIAIITGAGVSAESGVPTFRGAGGFWRKWQAQVRTHGMCLHSCALLSARDVRAKSQKKLGVVFCRWVDQPLQKADVYADRSVFLLCHSAAWSPSCLLFFGHPHWFCIPFLF